MDGFLIVAANYAEDRIYDVYKCISLCIATNNYSAFVASPSLLERCNNVQTA